MLKRNTLKAGITSASLICVALLFGCTAEVTQSASVDANATTEVSINAHAPNFTSANFDSEVLKSSKIVLVDCWASW